MCRTGFRVNRRHSRSIFDRTHFDHALLIARVFSARIRAARILIARIQARKEREEHGETGDGKDQG